MKEKKFNILGSEWTLKLCTVEENPKLKECDGYTDFTVREIAVDNSKGNDLNSLIDMNVYIKKVIRHELIHAFLVECGLRECSTNGWATNEEMVDFFAYQFPKLDKLFSDLEVGND